MVCESENKIAKTLPSLSLVHEEGHHSRLSRMILGYSSHFYYRWHLNALPFEETKNNKNGKNKLCKTNSSVQQVSNHNERHSFTKRMLHIIILGMPQSCPIKCIL